MVDTHSVLSHIRHQFTKLLRQNKHDRLQSIKDLAESNDAETELLLLYLLDDSSWEVRVEVVDALRAFNGPLTRLAMRASIEDSSDLVRDIAAEVLGDIGTARDIPRLIRALDDHAWNVRVSAAQSLGALGGRKAHQTLLNVLHRDSNAVVRREVALALSNAGEQAILPLQKALDKDMDKISRVGLLYALYKLGERQQINALLELLYDEDYLVRHNIVNILEADMVRAEDRETVARAIRQLIQHEKNPGVKKDAEQTLASLMG